MVVKHFPVLRERVLVAANPLGFGRGPVWVTDALPRKSSLIDDLRLFATTFAAGFLFVSILLA